MGTPDNKLHELVGKVRSWIPRRHEPANLSRDFWMPDKICRVCYECDAQFTVFNRRHHCRICGRVFCAKCTANSIPAPSDESKDGQEDWERVRVCNYCFKQWKQGIAAGGAIESDAPSPCLSPSPSATSLVSTKSSCTCNSSNSTVGSTPYSTGPYHHVPYISEATPGQSSQMDSVTADHDKLTTRRDMDSSVEAKDFSSHHLSSRLNRSDDEDDDYGVYHPNSSTGDFSREEDYCGAVAVDGINHVYGPPQMRSSGLDIESKITSSSENYDSQVAEGREKTVEVVDMDNGDECEPPLYDAQATDAEPVDFESSGLLWLPPEPADEDDEREAVLSDEDDDEAGGFTGEWGYLRSSNSFGSGEYHSRDKSTEDHKKAMKNVVEGHFRALVSQLLLVESLPAGDQEYKESWLDIITSLSWEAATLLKPDTSKSGGMDPGGYVKVKCIASGNRYESTVVKGVVCKKNVAHRRMTSKIDKPRILILGGALEYQRVSKHLSSFDTLLQQEKEHLKMAVAKIDAHHPNVLLVEKSVSRYAQDYLLEKNITLVLNIKRPLLERIARCTGAQILPSVDHLTSPKLGYCDTLHVERLFEEHGSAGQGGKKLTKTLMFFEGCPKALGCTILLKGANGDELKKVKHVLQYGVFAAYHLALETSFLADEGASLPELPLKSPITVALPDKPSCMDRSISMVPGFNIAESVKPLGSQSLSELPKCSNKGLISDTASATNVAPIYKSESFDSTFSPCSSNILKYNELSQDDGLEKKNNVDPIFPSWYQTAYPGKVVTDGVLIPNCSVSSQAQGQGVESGSFGGNEVGAHDQSTSGVALTGVNSFNGNDDVGFIKEEFPPSPSDHQSILVASSTRCVWKGTVCERSHLVRIKYYGSFDKPLGRFLRDQLFDQNYRCPSCDMPSEAHIYCYTHRQGSLTISVKKLPEFLLPGEREGKIWMWHRCLRCPRNRTNGFPPATRRVVMSDAAWGLSFGKFLELSFSNHAAASRVASCGHTLHRDCLRFYGYGRMVACFRYASIDVHSVYLPPAKLEFNYSNQHWVEKEANEVSERAHHLFTQVHNALKRILDKGSGSGSGVQAPVSRHQIAELERMLQREREKFEDFFAEALNREAKFGQPAVDILEINKLRRQILIYSYAWDQLLVHTTSLHKRSIQETLSFSIPKVTEKSVDLPDKALDRNASNTPGKSLSSSDSVLQEKQPNLNLYRGSTSSHVSHFVGDHHGKIMDSELILEKVELNLLSGSNSSDKRNLQESGKPVRRAFSEGQFPIFGNPSDSLDAAWTGEGNAASTTSKRNALSNVPPMRNPTMVNSIPKKSELGSYSGDKAGIEVPHAPSLYASVKETENLQNNASWSAIPFSGFNGLANKISLLDNGKLNITEYNPVYLQSFVQREWQSGARLLLPVGMNDTVIPVYDDEPTSIISYALVSSDYHAQIESERGKEAGDPSAALPSFDSGSLHHLSDDASEMHRSLGCSDESILSMSGSRSFQSLDPLSYTKNLHAKVSFADDCPIGKVKYTVMCYYAKKFEALRRIFCPSELDYIRSLSRCKKWGAQGGKSNVFFAKTLDDRFIIKQVTKTELESFIKFAPAYFKYLSDSIATGSPTCLAKILGIYQVSSKHLKGGKESKMDVLVMENLLFQRNIRRLYDLKGSSRSRYNSDTSGSNKVLLDQNLIEAMPTSPIFVGNKAKRLLERAVWNDTSFLASIDVMDYSLLVGADEEKQELVVGIIDFMRQYTWDKHLETWVKTSGILGGAKNTSPTVISPQQYKKRFRKAMTAYFLMVPDQWFAPTIVPSGAQPDLGETLQGGNSHD